ncbi:hypothetical protein [Vibrio sp. SCSIO 43136]|uniref:hypothetical protein n=1 Tax=Vibrio sp. SCSIO 43136 TaxID=2819101 RepID=UPI002075085F|nr:hypothetical protein [Vibrio sp. SCSIO 43136]USD64232.1 hypothetical protein J4N39_08925 [Vibrio sp. SCSIO 43136]
MKLTEKQACEAGEVLEKLDVGDSSCPRFQALARVIARDCAAGEVTNSAPVLEPSEQ